MTGYALLLSGINLGSARRVAMADLRAWLTDLGFGDARTHLNSGNAVFRADEPADSVVATVEATLAERAGFRVDCVARTADEMRAIVAGDPLGDLADNGSRYMVSFLSEMPEQLPGVDRVVYEPERFAAGERELYFWCPNGVMSSKLLPVFAAKRLGVTATVRNWDTVTKLAELVPE